MKRSQSRLTWVVRALVSTVLATSAMLMPSGVASAADTTTPVLSSFTFTGAREVTAGQQLTFSYVATDDSGSLGQLRLRYLRLQGHTDYLDFDGPLPVAGSVTITVPQEWWNGMEFLMAVNLIDPSGNSISYVRDHTSVCWPLTTSCGSSHELDLTAGDLTVSGSTADTTVPSLTSVSVSGSPVSPGQSINVRYDATDDSGSLKSIVLWYRDAYQIERTITAPGTGALPLKGDFEQLIPASWPDGVYLLKRVTLTDPRRNEGTYSVTGSVANDPPAATGPDTHTADFGAATFTVSGSAADFVPPVLTGVSLAGSPLAQGGTATLSYTAESEDPLSRVLFTYTDPASRWLSFSAESPQLSGTVSAPVPADKPLGTYILQEVRVYDSAGNYSTYRRDGWVLRGPGLQANSRHSIPLSTMDLLVSTLNVTVIESVRAASGSAVVFWNPSPDHGVPVTGYTITAQPGGRTVTTSGSADQAEITGLTNDTTYRFTITTTNAIGPGPASPLSSPATPRMSTNIMATGDVSGDGRTDLVGLRSTAGERMLTDRPLYVYRGNGLGGFAGSTRLSDYFTNQVRTAFSPGDFDGNGSPDLMTVQDNGYLTLAPGNGHGGFTTGALQKYVGTGWGIFLRVFSPADFSGDRKNDVMAISKDGGLYLYRGNGLGGFTSAGQRVGNGWAGFLTVFSRGDFSGDGKNDLLAVSKDGGLYLYRGNGLGGFTGAGQRVGNGWAGFLSVFSPGDFTGDHRTDVMAVSTAGDLLLYRGNGQGGWASGGQKVGRGWTIYR